MIVKGKRKAESLLGKKLSDPKYTGKKFFVLSETGKRLFGGYKTEKEAKNRLGQVEFFKRRGNPGAVIACGKCYRWAFMDVQDKGGTLVHGVVQEPLSSPPRYYDHAWVERNGRVYDEKNMEGPQGGKFNGIGYPIDVYKELFKPHSTTRYTSRKAWKVLQDEGGHYGPWENPSNPKRGGGGRSGRHKDRLPGGLADKLKPGDFDRKALAKGTKVELEHTGDRALAREITMDHLAEHPDYYDALEKMERGLEGNPRKVLYIQPNKSAVAAAKRGLKARAKAPKSKKGGLDAMQAKEEGVGSGVLRARDIIAGKRVNAYQVKAFFDRHRGNYLKAKDKRLKPEESRAIQAWLIWGGDPLYRQAKSAVEKDRKENPNPLTSPKAFAEKIHDWSQVLIQKGDKRRTRGQILKYYEKNARKIWPFLEGQTVMVILATGRNKFVLRRKGPDHKYIKLTKLKGIDDPHSFEYWIHRRVIEFHPVITGKTTGLIWIDVDPYRKARGASVAKMQRQIRKAVPLMRRLLKDEFGVNKAYVWRSGKKDGGWHVEGSLPRKMNVDKMRKKLRAALDEYFGGDPAFTTSIAKSGQIRLDTTLTKALGSLRSPYSYTVDGGQKLPVSVPEIAPKFKKETKRKASKRRKNPEGFWDDGLTLPSDTAAIVKEYQRVVPAGARTLVLCENKEDNANILRRGNRSPGMAELVSGGLLVDANTWGGAPHIIGDIGDDSFWRDFTRASFDVVFMPYCPFFAYLDDRPELDSREDYEDARRSHSQPWGSSRVLEQAARILKPGGELFINGLSPQIWEENLPWGADVMFQDVVNDATQAYIEDYLKSLGFIDIQFDVHRMVATRSAARRNGKRGGVKRGSGLSKKANPRKTKRRARRNPELTEAEYEKAKRAAEDRRRPDVDHLESGGNRLSYEIVLPGRDPFIFKADQASKGTRTQTQTEVENILKGDSYLFPEMYDYDNVGYRWVEMEKLAPFQTDADSRSKFKRLTGIDWRDFDTVEGVPVNPTEGEVREARDFLVKSEKSRKFFDEVVRLWGIGLSPWEMTVIENWGTTLDGKSIKYLDLGA